MRTKKGIIGNVLLVVICVCLVIWIVIMMMSTKTVKPQIDVESKVTILEGIQSETEEVTITKYQAAADMGGDVVLLGNMAMVTRNSGEIQCEQEWRTRVIRTEDVSRSVAKEESEIIEDMLEKFELCFEKYTSTSSYIYSGYEEPTDMQIFQDDDGNWNMLIRGAANLEYQEGLCRLVLVKYVDGELQEETLWYSDDVILGRDYKGVANLLFKNTQSLYSSLYSLDKKEPELIFGAIGDENGYEADEFYVFEDATIQQQENGYEGCRKRILDQNTFWDRLQSECNDYGIDIYDRSIGEVMWTTDVNVAYYYWIVNNLAQQE